MKLSLIVIGGLSFALMAYFFYAGMQSKSAQAPGLTHGKLSKCADKPNCVCSEYEDDATHYLHAISYSQSEFEPALALEQILLEMGGVVRVVEDNYLAAIFTSSVFKFVDDLELRIDPENRLIHIRAAARVGHHDGGVNRKRAETLVRAYTAHQAAH